MIQGSLTYGVDFILKVYLILEGLEHMVGLSLRRISLLLMGHVFIAVSELGTKQDRSI